MSSMRGGINLAFIVEGYKPPEPEKGSDDSTVHMSSAFGDTGQRFSERQDQRSVSLNKGRTSKFHVGEPDIEVTVKQPEQEQTAGSGKEDDHSLNNQQGADANDQQPEQETIMSTQKTMDSFSTKQPDQQQHDKSFNTTQQRSTNQSVNNTQQRSSVDWNRIFDRMSEVASSQEFQDAKKSIISSSKRAIKNTINKTKPIIETAKMRGNIRKHDRQFRKVRRASADGYRFAIGDDAVKILAYGGTDSTLKIPNAVQRRPITFINPGFLTGSAAARVQKIRLPKYLEYLSDNTFLGCEQLAYIIIPPNIKYVCKKAFRGCNPSIIYFLGECPSGMKNVYVPRRTKLLCTGRYADSFKGIYGIQVYK